MSGSLKHITSESVAIKLFVFWFYWVTQFSCHSHEHEADYIGMLLSASAGYDPRVAKDA